MSAAALQHDLPTAVAPPAPAAGGHSRWPSALGLALVVVVAVAAVHWPAVRAEALYFDDGMYLTENALVQNPSWDSLATFFGEVQTPSTVRGYYQPLTMTTLMLDVARGGRPNNLRPFHETSIVLHAVNAGLVAIILWQLFGNAWTAALLALLFGVHPVMVEPVPWVSERKTLLATLFALLAIIAYLRYTRRRGWGLYFAVAALFVLALLSKPTTTPLPVMLLLLDYWPLRRLRWGTLRKTIGEKIPLLCISAISAVVTVISQATAARVILPQERGPLHIPLTLTHNVVFYLYKLIWPTNLSSNYTYPDPFDLTHGMVLAGVIGTVVLTILVLVALRWSRAPLTAALIYFIMLFPTMGVIGFTNVIASHKYLYLPVIGILMLLALGATRLWSAAGGRGAVSLGRVAIVVSALAAAGVCSAATRHQIAQWDNTIKLYRYMLQFDPDDFALQAGFGHALVRAGQVEEGLEYLERAVERSPEHYVSLNNLGLAYAQQERWDEALDCFRRAIDARPSVSASYGNAARALGRLGRLDEARRYLEKAIEIDPHAADAHNSLAVMAAGARDWPKAEKHFRAAIAANPGYPNAYVGLARVLAIQGEMDEALETCERGLVADPKNDLLIRLRDQIMTQQATAPRGSP